MTAALLEAIVAAPDDDGPRLVYADWLLERGDLRGELIVAQCTLSACEAAGDRTSDRYRTAWIQDYLYRRDHAAQHAPFERGFPIRATVDFAREGIEPFLRLPLKWLSLEKNRPLLLGELRRILSAALPASLEHIEFGKAFRGVDIDVALARDALTRTRLTDDTRVWPDDRELPIPPFDETVRRYAGPLPVDVALPSSLRDLVITTMVPQEHWRNLRVSQLEEVAIYSGTDDEACTAIHALPFDRLRDFSIVSSTSYGVAVAKAFAEAAAGAPHLRGIEVTFPIDDAVARSLERSPLRLLRATGGGTLDALDSMLVRHPLHTLELAGFRSSDAVSALAHTAPPTLSNVTLDWFVFEDSDMEALAGSERLARVVDLELHECSLSAPAKAHLLTAKNLARIPSIRVDADTRREPT